MDMESLVFILCLVAFQGTVALQVNINYENPPTLVFSIPPLENDVNDVEFHYIINGHEDIGAGLEDSSGWRYETREANVDGADNIAAYAVFRDANNEHILTTQRTVLALRDTSIARLPPRRTRGAVIFRDDFNFFDATKWNYEVSVYGGNHNQFQVYTNEEENVFTQDGFLHIQPTLTMDDPRIDNYTFHHGKMNVTDLWGYCTRTERSQCIKYAWRSVLPPIKSGQLRSIPTLRYGVLEIRAKPAKGDWLWPSMWMMPREKVYGNWPRSGEIDILEARGNEEDNGVRRFTTTAIWGTGWRRQDWRTVQVKKYSDDWTTDFHTWRLEWTPDYLDLYVDDERYFHIEPDFYTQGGFTGENIWASGDPMAPFDTPYYMILNVAVGGTDGYFPERYPWAHPKPWSDRSRLAFQEFWEGRDQWYPTWQGNSALVVDYVEFRNL